MQKDLRRVHPEHRRDDHRKKAWVKPIFKNLRLGFEITMYFWNR